MNNPQIRSLAEIAAERGICPRSIANWCRKGLVLNCRKVNKSWVIVGPFVHFRSPGQRKVYEVIDKAVVATTGDVLKRLPNVAPYTVYSQLHALTMNKLIQVVRTTPAGMRVIATSYTADLLAGTQEFEERILTAGGVSLTPPQPEEEPEQGKRTAAKKPQRYAPKGMQQLRTQADLAAVPPPMSFAQLASLYARNKTSS